MIPCGNTIYYSDLCYHPLLHNDSCGNTIYCSDLCYHPIHRLWFPVVILNVIRTVQFVVYTNLRVIWLCTQTPTQTLISTDITNIWLTYLINISRLVYRNGFMRIRAMFVFLSCPIYRRIHISYRRKSFDLKVLWKYYSMLFLISFIKCLNVVVLSII